MEHNVKRSQFGKTHWFVQSTAMRLAQVVCCLLCCLGDGFLWGGLQPRRQFQADIVSQSTSGLANGRFGKALMAKKKDVEGGVSKATAKGEKDPMKAPRKASKAKSKAKAKTGAVQRPAP